MKNITILRKVGKLPPKRNGSQMQDFISQVLSKLSEGQIAEINTYAIPSKAKTIKDKCIALSNAMRKMNIKSKVAFRGKSIYIKN